jgi:hypothetical protein
MLGFQRIGTHDMFSGLTPRSLQDPLRIDLTVPSEVKYWTTVLNIDEETLSLLVRRLGPYADKIGEQLSGQE